VPAIRRQPAGRFARNLPFERVIARMLARHGVSDRAGANRGRGTGALGSCTLGLLELGPHVQFGRLLCGV